MAELLSGAHPGQDCHSGSSCKWWYHFKSLFLQPLIQPIIDHGNVDEYKTFIKKAVTNVTGPENVELYWFMLELFTDHDTTKCGRVNISQFPAMMSELVKTPKKLGLSTPAEVK